MITTHLALFSFFNGMGGTVGGGGGGTDWTMLAHHQY